ncbi:hypothetical protein DYI37_03150 [Fulvimarina endophytica]|uniref:DUF2190 family protein n=1 Tax=Fulvimarina endophytica TaxID=2293836 RepID=A0A371XB34_9HYPH|nr:hypothetical protein [Fulvimarina endophytica]RFC66455.1 hypothetical protein DYI37_03150 [Fulvimarina endophytica]
MAVSKPILKDAKPAGEDLSEALFLLVKLNSSGAYVKAAAGDLPAGSVYEAAKQGDPVTVDCKGLIKVKLGGAVTAGGEVSAGANGLAVASAAAGEGFAVARESGVANQIICVITK